MKLRTSYALNMYNWALTPCVTVWRSESGGGIALHFLRMRFACYTSK